MRLPKGKLIEADHLGLLSARKGGEFPLEINEAIVHGDPDRVIAHASLLEDSRIIAKKRGFISALGKWNGRGILITSSGMGTGSASIVFEELAELGIKTILRVGTSGTTKEEIKGGDLIVPTEVLIEGPVLRYLEPDYTRIRPRKSLPWLREKDGFLFVEVDNYVCETLQYEAKKTIEEKGKVEKHAVWAGPIYDKDILHAWRPEYSLDPEGILRLRNSIERITIGTDMESGALNVISKLRGLKAGSILVVVDFHANDEGKAIEKEAMQLAFEISLRTLDSLKRK
ncbi:MAG: hypothetical protein JHC28_06015 [Thermoprotei archaeon]|nr:hypothetical protein [Thermoprotei archaeon]